MFCTATQRPELLSRALPCLSRRANNSLNCSRTWILTRDGSASPLAVLSIASGLSLAHFDPGECVRLISPDLWLHWLSAQCQSCPRINGKRGWVRSAPAQRDPSPVHRGDLRVLSWGHSPTASSALTPQGTRASSAATSFSSTLNFFHLPPPIFLFSPSMTQAWSFLPPVQSFAWDGASFPSSFLTPKPRSRAGRRSRQLTPVPAHDRTGVSKKPSPAYHAQGTGLRCCPSPRGRPASVLSKNTGGGGGGQPAAPCPCTPCSAKSRSYFWRAASPGAEAAESGCADRKRKALLFQTQSEVSQPPAGEDGRHPCKNKRVAAGGLQMSARAISIKL